MSAKEKPATSNIHFLEEEWREWVFSSDVEVKKPKAHFLGFVKKKAEEAKVRHIQ
jgi:hypothetical protein